MSTLIRKAVWYSNRLAAMSPPEVLHRLYEAAKRKTGRRFAVVASEEDGALPCLPGLREGLTRIPEAILVKWEALAQQVRAGKFSILGIRWPESSRDECWHLDPVTGKSWPRDRYCFDIDYRHQNERGDVKYVWELNRLQYLQPVAALAFRKNDSELAKFCLSEIESWIGANPPYRGMNWASGIELALRVISILVVTSLVGEYATPRQCQKIRDTLRTHALWIERYPSRYSSANNHQTAESLGLFLIGALCSQLPQSEKWKMRGWDGLCDAAREQILPDGVGAEQAIAYTAVLVEMLLLGLHVARAMDVDVPENYTSRLMAAGEYLRWFTDSSGTQPRIGDDDEACVLGFRQPGENYVSSVLGCMAAVFRRADLVPLDSQAHFRNGIFGFPPAAAPAPEGVRCFERGGYMMGRSRIKERDVFLAMDHGPLGYLSIAAHGHADVLSIWLHIDGQPVFVDAGTYLYHSGGFWRRHFRGTAAHNTLCLEKTDSSRMAGPFNWSRKAKARVIASQLRPPEWYVEAEHDGYLKKFGALHRRRLSADVNGFVIEDWLTGAGARDAEAGFLLHPSLTASRNGRYVSISKDKKALLHIEWEGPLAPDIGLPGTEKGGWYSPSFGRKQSTTRLAFSGTLEPEQKSVIRFLIV